MRSDKIIQIKDYRLMYNYDQKEEYIVYEGKNSGGNNSLTIKNYFKRISGKETEYQKDLADMDIDELKDTLVSLNIRREESRGHLISLLRGYVFWARLYGKTNNDSAIHTMTPDSINAKNAIVSQMIRDPDHLDAVLENSVLKKDDKYLMPNRTKRDMLVFWLAYNGLKLGDMSTLKITDFDKESTVIVKNKKYHICDRTIFLWNHCSAMTNIERRNGKASGKRNFDTNNDLIYYDLTESEYIFKNIRGVDGTIYSEHLNERALGSIILKICKMHKELTGDELRVTAESIRWSGIFHNIYLMELNGIYITSEIIAEHFSISFKNSIELSAKTRKWRKDYENWKLAFDLV